MRTILSIARYESKTLMRSWFFRIFAILSLVILFFYNFFSFANPGSAIWGMRAVASTLPYANVFLLNIVQAIIAVFLSSEFLQKDKKLDTAEVILVRPVSNTGYIFGKTLGILWVFLVLNIIVLGVSMAFNLVVADTPIIWEAYLYFPLFLSLPSLVFILGFSFLVMMLAKNQALTYIIVFGFVSASMFFLQGKAYNLFDYLGLSLPMIYSDFVGFGNGHLILLHRLSYFLIGAGAIGLTVRLLNRLPNKQWIVNAMALTSFFVMGAGLFSGYLYYHYYSQTEQYREELITLNNEYFSKDEIEILQHHITFAYKGSQIFVNSEMKVCNTLKRSRSTLIFSINPGLDIDFISLGGVHQEIKKHGAIVELKLDQPLNSGEVANLKWKYHGRMDDRVVGLDTWWDYFYKPKNLNMIKVNKNTLFVTPNYVLLTPSTLWYPIAGVTYNHTTHLNRSIKFTDFRLTVTCPEPLKVISQGRVQKDGGIWKFTPSNRLSGLSLIIGDYEQSSITVDEVEYNLYHLEGHDYYAEYFTHISDTLPEVIRTIKGDFERLLDLYYPFERFSLVEVPAQYHAYQQRLSAAFESVQPEMVLLNENGIGLQGADFRQAMKYEKDKNKRNKNAKTPTEIETGLFLRFVNSTFLSGIPKASSVVRRTGGANPNSRHNFKGMAYSDNPNVIFPLYYNHMAGFNSTDAPYFNRIMESYFMEGFQPSFREAMSGGMTEAERANLLLKEKSMSEILSENKYRNLFGTVVTQKGNYLISLIQKDVGASEWDNFIYYYIEDHAYENLTFEDFKKSLKDSLGYDIEPYLDQWLNTNQVASFLTSDMELFQTRDDYGPVYLAKFKVTNYANAAGVLYANLRVFGGGGGFSGSSSTEERIYTFKPNETKDIQIMLYEQPRLMSLSTMIANNVPGTYVQFFRRAERKELVPEEYEHTISQPVTINAVGDIVVDNEDKGFELISHRQESKLKAFVERNKEEEEIKYRKVDRMPPRDWRAVTHTGFYGTIVRSAWYTRSGRGDMKAKWSTVLPEGGTYEVYVYVPMMAMMASSRSRDQGNRSRGGSSGGERGRGGRPKMMDEGFIYNYKINTADGDKNVQFKMSNIENGWNRLGAYYFNADSVSIELSNKMDRGSRIFADAVKWVKVN